MARLRAMAATSPERRTWLDGSPYIPSATCINPIRSPAVVPVSGTGMARRSRPSASITSVSFSFQRR